MFPEHDGFEELYQIVKGSSMLTRDRLLSLYNVALYCNNLDGDFAEIGCHAGGTSYLLASVMNKGKALHSFDSFQGLSDPVEQDRYDNGSFQAHKGMTKSDKLAAKFLLSVFGDDVIIHDGWIQDTLSEVSDKKFSLVYIDVDIYEPTKLATEFFWNRIVKDGYIVYDDYMWGSTIGVTRYINNSFPNLFLYNHYFVYPQLGIRKP
jgi:O-methyltransferase